MGITKEGTALSITRWIALLFFMGVLGACGESPVEPHAPNTPMKNRRL